MTNDEIVAYRDALAARLRSVMAGRGLDQASVSARMSTLGYSWHRQTVSAVLKGSRRLTAEEILGLSIVLEVSISELMAPLTNSARSKFVSLPGGVVVAASEVSGSAGAGMPGGFIRWDGDEPVLPSSRMLDSIGSLPDTTADVRAAMDKRNPVVILSDDEIAKMVDPIQEQMANSAFELLDDQGVFDHGPSESAADRESRKQAWVEATKRDIAAKAAVNIDEELS